MGTTFDICQKTLAAFDTGRLDDFDTLFHWDGEMTMPHAALRGPEQIKGMLAGYREAFSDMRHEILNYVESADTLAWELLVTATHTGTMVTPGGDVPPTGKKVEWHAADYIKVVDGRVASWHVYFDQVALLTQLGLMPSPATA
ncbi:MAG: hypothetical protein QOG64_641 [Acidimicrobiaceae bacterium]|jgi:ketosteroid isomerase-like protein|nr:hypothetical protein [Acidimicrobiaceae bacterium]